MAGIPNLHTLNKKPICTSLKGWRKLRYPEKPTIVLLLEERKIVLFRTDLSCKKKKPLSKEAAGYCKLRA